MNSVNRTYLKYEEAKPLIEEADILLYRGRNIMANIIKFGGGGVYSHVGLASWSNGGKSHDTSVLEVLEFRTFGGMGTNLDIQVQSNSGIIDIYRPVPSHTKLYFDPYTKNVLSKQVTLQPKLITKEMRRMSGLPYGFKRIWWLLKYKMFGWFIGLEPTTDDNDLNIIYPICSTALAHCFTKYEYDLVKNKSDEWTEPSAIAESPLIQYLFTITA